MTDEHKAIIQVKEDEGIYVYRGGSLYHHPKVGEIHAGRDGRSWLVFLTYPAPAGWCFWFGQDPERNPCDEEYMREIST